jgi:hypothetical protein
MITITKQLDKKQSGNNQKVQEKTSPQRKQEKTNILTSPAEA